MRTDVTAVDERNKKTTKLSWETNQYIIKNSKDGLSQVMQLHNAWEKIAPPAAMEVTDNITFSSKSKKTEVLVFVENSHWSAELGAQKELYRILMEQETGLKISDMRFPVTREAAFKKIFQRWKDKAATAKARERAIPLTREEDRYAREMVSGVKDKKLQNRLYIALKADLEWKKGREGLKLPENPPESPETI